MAERRSRRVKSWICKNGHPLSRNSKGGKYCFYCGRANRFVKNGVKYCGEGHRRLASETRCAICNQYRVTPWLRYLDTHGEALCPKGHLVSHEEPDSLFFYRDGRRACAYCRDTTLLQANIATRLQERETCRSGKHPWIPENWVSVRSQGVQCKACKAEARVHTLWRKRIHAENAMELEPHYVDWVMVHRAMTDVPDDKLYQVRRGKSRGMTPGEKWVTYCTYVAQYGEPKPETLVDTAAKMLRWKQESEPYGFPFKTIHEVIGEITGSEYSKGKML